MEHSQLETKKYNKRKTKGYDFKPIKVKKITRSCLINGFSFVYDNKKEYEIRNRQFRQKGTFVWHPITEVDLTKIRYLLNKEGVATIVVTQEEFDFDGYYDCEIYERRA